MLFWLSVYGLASRDSSFTGFGLLSLALLIITGLIILWIIFQGLLSINAERRRRCQLAKERRMGHSIEQTMHQWDDPRSIGDLAYISQHSRFKVAYYAQIARLLSLILSQSPFKLTKAQLRPMLLLLDDPEFPDASLLCQALIHLGDKTVLIEMKKRFHSTRNQVIIETIAVLSADIHRQKDAFVLLRAADLSSNHLLRAAVNDTINEEQLIRKSES